MNELTEAIKKLKDNGKEVEALQAEETILKSELTKIDDLLRANKIDYFGLQMNRVMVKSRLDRIFNRSFALTGIYNHL